MEKERLIEIVSKARQGDENAKEALYLDAYLSVYRFALRLVKNPEDAEDITQEVFIAVNEKISELREPPAFYKWVNQITVNKCNELLRKYKGLARLDDEEEYIALVDDDPMNLPDRAIDDEATRKIIMDVIDALPDGQRACVLYYYYLQFTVAQIADMLEINEGTVKSRLSTARVKIRAALEEKEKKEGIKLYGIPLALTPILRQAIEQMLVPDGLAERMWENIQKAEAGSSSSNGGSGADQSGGPGTSGQNVPKSGTAESISNIAAATAKTGGAVSSTKAIALIVGGVMLAAAIAATVVFWPLISEMFSPGGAIPVVVTESPQDETVGDTLDITMSSWAEQATGRYYTFIEDNTVSVINQDGALIESGTYFIEDGQMRLTLAEDETLLVDFNIEGDEMTITYQEGPVVYYRIPQIGDIPSREGHGDIGDFIGMWTETFGGEYAFYDDSTVTITSGNVIESGTYDIYANSIRFTFDGNVRVMRFELSGDELVLTLQGHQTYLTRTGRADAPADSAAIPPGRYVKSAPNENEYWWFQINSDGTFIRQVYDFGLDRYCSGTYTVIGDMVHFVDFLYSDYENMSDPVKVSTAYGQYWAENSHRYNYIFRFDGTNLINVNWDSEVVKIGEILVPISEPVNVPEANTPAPEAAQETSLIPPGKYVNSAPNRELLPGYKHWFNIYDDGTFVQHGVEFEGEWYRSGTYTVSGDIVYFVTLFESGHEDMSNSSAISEAYESWTEDSPLFNYTFRFDGTNLISVDFVHNDVAIGDVFVRE